MRKDIIKMSKKELNRLAMIHQVLDKRIKQKAAAELLNLCVRQVGRIVKRVRKQGDASIVHGNRGKESNRKFPEKFKEDVLKIVKKKYPDFGPTFAAEKLEEINNKKLSRETLRCWMIEEHIWTPRKLKDKGNVHLWRERKECFGEMVLTDGSIHDWLEGRGPKMVLMAYIDDATGKPFGRFYPAEDVTAAMDSFKRYIKKYGIPESIYFDRNSIYKTTRQPNLDEELKGERPKTQFEKVLLILDVKPIRAYSPQAKGRIERLFKTFQDRLIKELRLANICNIEDANKFLKTYLPKYISRFSVPARNSKNLHNKIPKNLDLNWVFAFRDDRTISNDFTVRWNNRFLLLTNPSLSLKRKKVMVIENLKGQIRICIKNKILEFKEITEKTLEQIRKTTKLMKATAKKTKAKKPYKPAENHPWRMQNRALFSR